MRPKQAILVIIIFILGFVVISTPLWIDRALPVFEQVITDIEVRIRAGIEMLQSVL